MKQQQNDGLIHEAKGFIYNGQFYETSQEAENAKKTDLIYQLLKGISPHDYIEEIVRNEKLKEEIINILMAQQKEIESLNKKEI